MVLDGRVLAILAGSTVTAGCVCAQASARRNAVEKRSSTTKLQLQSQATVEPSAPQAPAAPALAAPAAPRPQQLDATLPPPPAPVGERPMGLRTVVQAMQACDRISSDAISGPFQMNAGDQEAPVICFQFQMQHFTCKAYIAHGLAEEDTQHFKLQTVFEDNRRALGEEQRYFLANEWNASKRYTRLKCGPGALVFTLEYDILLPSDLPHSSGLSLLSQTLRMWYTSMVACVIHIVEQREVPFGTHDMITANTISVTIRDEDQALHSQACPICFEAFRVGETVRRLPCMHIFHVVSADVDDAQGDHCNIDRHLVRDKQCPVCKTPIDIMERGTSPGCKNQDLSVGNSTSSQGAAAPASTDASAPAVPAQAASPPGTEVDAGSPVETSSPSDVAAVAAAAERSLGSMVALASAPLPQAPVLSDTTALPEQAAALERAVRSLQARWNQIQDVVASMQQMLRYIEESQSLVNAARQQAQGQMQSQMQARAVQNQNVQETEPYATPPSDTAQPFANDMEVEATAAPNTGLEPDPAMRSQEPSPNGTATLAEEARLGAEPALQASQPDAVEQEAARTPPQAIQEAVSGAADAGQAAVLHGMDRSSSDDPQRSAREAAGTQELGQPFTEAEKVCMAYLWRRRRVGSASEQLASLESQAAGAMESGARASVSG